MPASASAPMTMQVELDVYDAPPSGSAAESCRLTTVTASRSKSVMSKFWFMILPFVVGVGVRVVATRFSLLIVFRSSVAMAAVQLPSRNTAL